MSNSIKKLKKLVNADLKHLVNWLNANKISLNIKKLKRLYPTESVICLGVKIDKNLSWKYLVIDVSTKLNRTNALLFLKRRKYISLKILPLIWVGFLGVPFEVGKRGITPCLKLVRITLETSNLACKYSHISSFRKYTF